MQELRWILLLAGVLFLIVLAAWEMLRARRSASRREIFPHLDHELPREPMAHATPARDPLPRESSRSSAEPSLGSLPEGLVESAHLDGAAAEPIRAQRGGPPLTELPQMSAVHLEASGREASDFEASESSAITQPVAAAPAAAEPASSAAECPEPALYGPAAAEAMPAREDPGAAPPSQAAATAQVDWPPEGERQILSVRIVSTSEQRLSGRSVRQALAACGFVHGRYHIFHQATEDGRVLLSCASLNKPGNFDPSSMDFQRYSGLSIFAVLPGPLPAQVALERLLSAGLDVSQRLQARLLDERGEPLDSRRIAALRAGVAGGAVGRSHASSAVGGEPRA